MAKGANPTVSVVIVSFNTREILRECLNTLEREAGSVTFETIVVDNCSRDGSPAMIRDEFPQVHLISSETNAGFAGANNLAFPHCHGEYVVLLNSDAFLKPGALELAVKHMEETPRAGLGGARLISRDGSWQPSARMFPSLVNDLLTLSGLSSKFSRSRLFGRADRTWASADEAAQVDWVPGAFSIIRRSTLEEIGYFDPRFFLYYEEVDLCKRIKDAGYEIWYWPDVVVIHLGGESSKTVENLTMSSAGSQLTLWRMRSALLYYRKHHNTSAKGAMLLEKFWHLLRMMKNRSGGSLSKRAKAEESARLVGLMEQAWAETNGGRVSPPRPW